MTDLTRPTVLASRSLRSPGIPTKLELRSFGILTILANRLWDVRYAKDCEKHLYFWVGCAHIQIREVITFLAQIGCKNAHENKRLTPPSKGNKRLTRTPPPNSTFPLGDVPLLFRF